MTIKEVFIWGILFDLKIKSDGFYFKSREKRKSQDVFIPFKEIKYWNGICLEDRVRFLRVKHKYLIKLYTVMFFLFVLFGPKPSFAGIVLYFVLFFVASFMFFLKLQHITLYADNIKVEIKIKDLKNVCLFLDFLRRKCKKDIFFLKNFLKRRKSGQRTNVGN